MNPNRDSFFEAFRLLAGFDANLVEIVLLSLQVSLTAVALAAILGLPLGGLLATARFPGRGALIAILNALMGLPPVVVGLGVYLVLSRGGPLGPLQLLYSPTAMILAQALLVLPIIAALSRQTLEEMHEEYREQFRLFGLGRLGSLATLAFEARYNLVTALLAGFGRAIAEVGAVMIVGGNIDHLTRVMTTTIALETSRGNFALAMGLGIVLVGLALAINALAQAFRSTAERARYA
jgi:tungstate transport system permease protein